MILDLSPRKGIMPKVAAHLLPPGAAQQALNCLFGSGDLKPLKEPSFVVTPSKAGTKKSIYKAGYSGAEYWLHWLTDVNVCRSPIANDVWDRLYWTGDSEPRMTTKALAVTGGTDYPHAWYKLGIPAPTTPPVLAAAGTPVPDPADPLSLVSTAVVYTFVSAYGEEGPPSDPSNLVDIAPGQFRSITLPGSPPAGNYNITHVRIYRTNTGSTTTEYLYVDTVAVATTTYNDLVAAADLGEVLPSTTWEPPPATLAGLTELPNGSFAGFVGNTVWLSEPYQPHAWPYSYSLSDQVVGLATFGNTLLVLTNGDPRAIVLGGDLSALSPERLENGFACVSKRGIVDMGMSVVYPSAEGLVAAGVNGVQLLGEALIDRAWWQSLTPSTIHAYVVDHHYVAFHSGGSFMLNTLTGDLSTLEYDASSMTGGFYDKAAGELYLIKGADIVKWRGGSNYLTCQYKSGKKLSPRAVCFAVAVVQAESYPLTFKLYADGVLKLTKTVASAAPFRLPGGFLATAWEGYVSGTAVVNQVLLAQSFQELAQVAPS